MSKFDTRLQALVSGGASQTTTGELRSTVRPDGTREYEVIIHGSSAEDIRGTGAKVLSTFGEVFTARASTDELKILAGVRTVRFMETGSRNFPQ